MASNQRLKKAAEHIDQLLSLPRQIWLLGAGVSKDAGVPLMYPLTDRVEALLGVESTDLGGIDTVKSHSIFQRVRQSLPEDDHVEHVLSHIGDLISIGERKTAKSVQIDKQTFSTDELREAHHEVQLAIRHTVEYGYTPPSDGHSEQIGTVDSPIVDRQHHDKFIAALFKYRRAGLEQNPPVKFSTTNYDTLLEDSLAYAQVPYVDGFAGGGTAFWDPKNNDLRLSQATRFGFHSSFVYKLHGSIDWVCEEDDIVMRIRSSAARLAKAPTTRLLIYPQATKYQVSQRDPFATLFAEFRRALETTAPTVLVICGYSFGDEHINEEIERALRQRSNTLTLLALCEQKNATGRSLDGDQGLPMSLVKWLSSPAPWKDRVLVAGSSGFYRGSLANQLDSVIELNWWTFNGIADMLANGPESVK